MAFIIVAQHELKNDKINDFIHSLKPLIDETRCSHAGCVNYELFQDLDNPALMTMIEEWKDQDALDKHMQSPLFKKTIAEFVEYLKAPVRINRYQRV
ncbi:antibiotic biosynthesis monooxygenase [Clostridium sp. DSM 17811]|uniref:putative quinol monooxygenase n=1 Tax=Clostridium sp. DSM 17811 TaxID=2843317 RepID=UPI001C0AD6FB|nr:putative quinol monooxygenase [Clostridium sp. DSM 17811]MBU3101724.1 antibiotic biosynthesis monooxygenase [Clostridium sp. DSM 17811]